MRQKSAKSGNLILIYFNFQTMSEISQSGHFYTSQQKKRDNFENVQYKLNSLAQMFYLHHTVDLFQVNKTDH